MSHDCFTLPCLSAEHADAGASSLMSVVHNKATVKREKLKDVAGDDKYRINNLLDEKYEPRPIKEILQDAETTLGKELPYNLLTMNCEHFVTKFRNGKPYSRQVQLFDLTLHIELYCTH